MGNKLITVQIRKTRKRMSDINKLFLELLRVAIGTQDCLSRLPNEKEWKRIYKKARKQSVVGICFAGIRRLGADIDEGFARIGLSDMVYLKWMGMAAKTQLKYSKHRVFIAKLAKFYEQKGIGMMLLKGYGLSLFYPEPQLRQPGDVDVYLFNNDGSDLPAWKRADNYVRQCMEVEVRNDCEHHTKFEIDGFFVENHYDFVNKHIRRSSERIECVFKELAEDKSKYVMVDGQKVYLPSDKLNALFLLRHAAGHFASEGITIRNVLDWGMFVRNINGIDWEWLWQIAHEYNMHRFLMCMNSICMEELGMDHSKFTQRYEDKVLKERVLTELMQGKDLVPRASVWTRINRWWKHRWKHEICYSDSMLSSFVYSVKANMMHTSVE